MVTMDKPGTNWADSSGFVKAKLDDAKLVNAYEMMQRNEKSRTGSFHFSSSMNGLVRKYKIEHKITSATYMDM